MEKKIFRETIGSAPFWPSCRCRSGAGGRLCRELALSRCLSRHRFGGRRRLLRVGQRHRLLLPPRNIPPPSSRSKASWNPAATIRDLSKIREFEWPPAKASARIEIPRSLFSAAKSGELTLGEVAGRLEFALDKADYEHSYFRIGDDGFALTTRMERMEKSGKPDPNARWNPPDAAEPLSLFGFIASLLWPEPGYYRMIVFAVTPKPYRDTNKETTSKKASDLTGGVVTLPTVLGEQAFTAEHHCFALIYEFAKHRPDATPVLIDPSRFSAKEHMRKAAIWAALQTMRQPVAKREPRQESK